ncbi:MAG TPA: Gfo/Idh/MocA family oxidoreductase [Thermomicrobiales bacterium]|nr:Gfo/Idh/MocA family oxidoreductase [Thermomicrobiales bacterium]
MTISADRPIRWGILGTGRIAHHFANGLKVVPDAELVAVGSRTQETADAFGDEFGVARRHGSYQALAADSDVDVIYISTPHQDHKASTLLCLEAGRNVLCEKPFAINAGEAREMVDSARAKDLFLMEAMWTRFRPAMVKVRELIANGDIGEPRFLSANIGWMSTFDPAFRLYNPDLGGGALLDGGVYPVSFSSMVLGTPSAIASVATLGKTNVDEQEAIALAHPTGAVASLGVTIQAAPISIGLILGTRGRIELHHDWHRPEGLTFTPYGGQPERFDYPQTEGNGYQYEAMEVGRCLREGLTESPVMPLDETLSIMETMDTLRAQWGVRYPME